MLEGLYLLIVLGCTDELTRCRPIERIDGGWSEVAACEAAIAEALRVEGPGADFPMITGRCVPAPGSAVAGDRARRVSPAG
jgi:hypothetical protein